MKITGVIPTAIVNIGIIAAVSAAVVILDEGTALLGLTFLQPLPIQAVAENGDELRASMDYADEESGNPIGFVHD
jgi:hypothetical protein